MEKNNAPAKNEVEGGAHDHLGEDIRPVHQIPCPCTPAKHGSEVCGRAKLDTSYGAPSEFPPTPEKTPTSGKRAIDNAFDDVSTGSPCPRKVTKLHGLPTVEPSPENYFDGFFDEEFPLNNVAIPPASPQPTRRRVAMPCCTDRKKRLPALAADEFKRLCEAVLDQVDWRAVEEDVASNRGVEVYRAAIMDVMQGTYDEAWLVQRSDARMREQRAKYERIHARIRAEDERKEMERRAEYDRLMQEMRAEDDRVKEETSTEDDHVKKEMLSEDDDVKKEVSPETAAVPDQRRSLLDGPFPADVIERSEQRMREQRAKYEQGQRRLVEEIAARWEKARRYAQGEGNPSDEDAYDGDESEGDESDGFEYYGDDAEDED